MTDKIKVIYMGLVKHILGVAEEEVPISEGMQVSDLIQQLWQRHGTGFAQAVLNRDGSLRTTSRLLLDNRDIETLQGLETRLEGCAEASIVVVVYPVEGG